jgi:hypothetical protein
MGVSRYSYVGAEENRLRAAESLPGQRIGSRDETSDGNCISQTNKLNKNASCKVLST